MRGLPVDPRRAAFVMGLQKPGRATTRLIARFQSRKPPLWARGRQVIADIFRKRQKLRRHQRANRMAAVILCAGVTRAIAEKARQRVIRTWFQRIAENIEGGVWGYTAHISQFTHRP